MFLTAFFKPSLRAKTLRAAAFALALAPMALHAEALDAIVALVEDDVILRSELDAAVNNIKRQYADKQAQLPPPNVLEKQVLERLIIGKLQVLRAQETGVDVTDTEVDQAMARVAQSNQLTIDQLQAALARDGIRLSDFRTSMREEILSQKLRQRVVQSRAEVNESEIDILLASGQLKQGEVRIAHLLVALPDNPSAEQIELANKKIGGVKALIDEGKMEFSAAAIRYSDAKDALEGGEIGWRRFDQMPALFADATSGLEAGQMSQILRSPAGLHLIKVQEKRETSAVMVTEFNARHILLNVDELTSADEAEKTIRAIADTVRKGGDFAAEAKKYSDDAQTAALGGDMGWFDIASFGTTYEETIQALDDKQVSEPFRTERGWHLVQRLGTRQQDRTEDYIRNQARESIRQRKSEDAFAQFVRQLRNESFVEDRLADPQAAEINPASEEKEG
jgi:peptidyl-prolyl cis-trans isomerase SurA